MRKFERRPGPDHVPAPREADVAEAVRRGQRYMDARIPPKTPAARLIWDQLQYLSPALWLTQFTALVLLVAAAYTAQDMDHDTARDLLLLLSPLTAVFGVPELFKDVSCGMLEIEMTCKNNSATIFRVRLLLVGLINIGAIALFSSLLSAMWALRFSRVILYGLIPVNLVYILELFLFRSLKPRGRRAVLASSILSAVIVCAASTRIADLVPWREGTGAALLLLTAGILAAQGTREVSRISKRQGVMLWNY